MQMIIVLASNEDQVSHMGSERSAYAKEVVGDALQNADHGSSPRERSSEAAAPPPQEFYSRGCSGALFLRPQYAICSAKLELKLRHRDLTHYVSKAVRTLVRNKHSDMLNTLTNTTFPILNYITQFFLYGMA